MFRLTVVIISQYIDIPNRYVVHLRLLWFYMSTIFSKGKQANKQNKPSTLFCHQDIHVILMHRSLKTAATEEQLRFSKVGTSQRRWLLFQAKQEQLLGNASPTLVAGSLFPILPTWLSLLWHPLWGKYHRDPRDHQVFSVIPLRQQHSSRSTMPVSQWLVTCQGNFRPWLPASSLCPVTRSLARTFCWLWTLCIHLFPTFPLLPAQDSPRRPLYDLTSAGNYDFK